MARQQLFNDFFRTRFRPMPSRLDQVPVAKEDDMLSTKIIEGTAINTATQLNDFRTLAQDRMSQYNAYDEMATDSVIAAALEIYADDATCFDEKGRVIWVEAEDQVIADAANRILNILEIPERAWKHIYMLCKYGDYYLRFNRDGIDVPEERSENSNAFYQGETGRNVKVVNDKVTWNDVTYQPHYDEYIEDIYDPATIFDLQKRGKTTGFIEVKTDLSQQQNRFLTLTHTFNSDEIIVYPADQIIHFALSETMSRTPETVTLTLDGSDTTYDVKRGKSILYDVYPIEKQLQLLEDALALNRLTRSALIRLLEIETGDMPKKEVNAYLRRIKNLMEQHIAMNKDTGAYKSYQAPGPVENILYIPVQNGKGHIEINNLGGDVNIRDIADVEYFNDKRAGALKIPKAYLGDDMEGEGLSNGGSLTKLSARYARTIVRIQQAYIRGITTMLNLFFIDKKLDYVNKFEVKMTSPNTQDDLDRTEVISNNVGLVTDIMSLVESLDGDTQKEVLTNLITNIMKMPDISDIIEVDRTPVEDIDIEGTGSTEIPTSPFDSAAGPVGGGLDMSNDFDVGMGIEPSTSSEPAPNESTPTTNSNAPEAGFTPAEYGQFQDTL